MHNRRAIEKVRSSMLRILFVGNADSPELTVLRERPQVGSVEVADNVQDGLDLSGTDGVFIAMKTEGVCELLTQAVKQGIPVHVVPGVFEPEQMHSLNADVRRMGVTTNVGRTVRHAINLQQVRQSGRQKGLRWISVRVFDTVDSPSRLEEACDLLRYVGGDVDEIVSTVRGTDISTATLRMVSGVPAQITAGRWQADTGELSVEILTNEERFTWSHGPNTILIDGVDRYSVAEKEEGFLVANIGAFVTAIDTGNRTPVLCDLEDAVASLDLQQKLLDSWRVSQEAV